MKPRYTICFTLSLIITTYFSSSTSCSQEGGLKIDGKLVDGAIVCESASLLGQATKKAKGGWSLMSTFQSPGPGGTTETVTQEEGLYETQEACNAAMKNEEDSTKQNNIYRSKPIQVQYECKRRGKKVYPNGCSTLDLAGVTMSGKKSDMLIPVTIRRRLKNGVVYIAFYNIYDMRDRGDGVIVWRYTTKWGWTLEKYIVPYAPYSQK